MNTAIFFPFIAFGFTTVLSLYLGYRYFKTKHRMLLVSIFGVMLLWCSVLNFFMASGKSQDYADQPGSLGDRYEISREAVSLSEQLEMAGFVVLGSSLSFYAFSSRRKSTPDKK